MKGTGKYAPSTIGPAVAGAVVGAVLWCVASPGQARVVERVAAVVNKQIILLSEVRERTIAFEGQLQQVADPNAREQRRKDMHKQVLGQMVDELLIGQQAAKLKLEVKDEEVEAAVNQVMKRNNFTREQLQAALAQEGKSIHQYKQQILRPQLLRLKVLNVQVRSRVSVREDEIKALYQKSVRSLGAETKVRARHIFLHIPPGSTPETIREQNALAQKLLRQLRAGGDFAALAREHSDDSVTNSEGGDLGFVAPGTLPANIEDVVFKLEKGAIAGPLRSTRGLHLIQVTDREASSARPYDKVREQLRNQLLNQKTEKATRVWLNDVRKRSYVDLRL